MKSLYITWFGLFSGGPQNSPQTLPARFSQLGYGFFVIIALASYTANLATILVAKSQKNGITSIDDAIAAQLTICCLDAVLPSLAAKYPTANLVGTDDDRRTFRELNKGACGAAIMSEEEMNKGFAGVPNEWDCQELDDNKVSAFEADTLTFTAESGACQSILSVSVSLV
jgi:hypothetical protein